MNVRTMSDLEVLLVLNRVPGCDARKVKVLMSAAGGIGDILREEHLKMMSEATLFGSRFVKTIRETLSAFDPAQELQRMNDQGIDIVPFSDERYPVWLQEIHDPPVLLYLNGKLVPSDNGAVSIVGSRKASFYGQEMAEKLAYELAEAGITIVSGLAAGIDSAAHRGALRAGGRTIAVLGCGVDVIYPSQNQQLYEMITGQGAVVSEFPLGTEPYYYNFPKRNRIISGMTRGTVVVEAARRSGSLITARLALDEGREVYSVPGKANAYSSEGTNNLIKEGARLITSAGEIIDDLFPQRERSCSAGVRCTAAAAQNAHIGERHTDALFDCISAEPIYIEELIKKTNMPESDIFSVLAVLEITHRVRRLAGGGYVRSGM